MGKNVTPSSFTAAVKHYCDLHSSKTEPIFFLFTFFSVLPCLSLFSVIAINSSDLSNDYAC